MLRADWPSGTAVAAFWWENPAAPFDHRLPSLTQGQWVLLAARPRERNGEVQIEVLGLTGVT